MIFIYKEVMHTYLESPAQGEPNDKVDHGNSGMKHWEKDCSRQSYYFKFWTPTDLSTSLQFCQLETMSSVSDETDNSLTPERRHLHKPHM